jgi:AcrR family transcriptional regulator
MSEAVKPGRPYQGAARQARTRRTRAAIAAAARSLFAERGYAATTIEAISDRSDTPQATVYRLFSSKLGILKALLDDSVAGDDEAVAMLDRPQVRALLSAADPKDQLAGFAALVRDVMTRVGPVHRILADAARSDQDAASLLAEIARQRHEGQRRIASSLARSGALRPGLAERDAADIIHALASPEVHGLLVSDRGWTSERHEKWLRQILIDQLLPRELPEDHADQAARHKKPGTSGLTKRRDWLTSANRSAGIVLPASLRRDQIGRRAGRVSRP